MPVSHLLHLGLGKLCWRGQGHLGSWLNVLNQILLLVNGTLVQWSSSLLEVLVQCPAISNGISYDQVPISEKKFSTISVKMFFISNASRSCEVCWLRRFLISFKCCKIVFSFSKRTEETVPCGRLCVWAVVQRKSVHLFYELIIKVIPLEFWWSLCQVWSPKEYDFSGAKLTSYLSRETFHS